MSCLVDTSILSQTVKPQPDLSVMRWWTRRTPGELLTSAIVIHELRFGIERMPLGQKRSLLDRWLSHQVLAGFGTRILPIDAIVADESGRLIARMKAAGHNPDVADVIIAATAAVHNLTVATLD